MPRPANPHREKIIALRKAGKWPHEIAAELGIGRNSVIGICNRAGLCSADVRGAGATFLRYGEEHPNARLTEAAVRDARRRYVAHDPINGASALARELGVSYQAVRLVVTKQTWRHVA